MADDYWQSGTSGAWEDASNWSLGLPAAGDNVDIYGSGAVTVTVSSTQAMDALTVLGARTTLVETSDAALDVGTGFGVAGGATVVLNGTTTNADGALLSLVGSHLIVGDGAGLGSMKVEFIGQASLLGTADLDLANEIEVDLTVGLSIGAALSQAVIQAAHATTMTLSGEFDIGPEGGELQFGSATNDGTVVLALSSANVQAFAADNSGERLLDIGGGVVRLADAAAASLFGAADLQVQIASSAVLDLGGQATVMAGLSLIPGDGPGTAAAEGVITNSGSVATLTLGNGAFAGAFTGNLDLDFAGAFDFAGTIKISGAITVSGALGFNGGGVIKNEIVMDGGAIVFSLDSALTIKKVITGTGLILVDAGAPLTLTHANSFAGAFVVTDSTLTVTKVAALGLGGVAIFDGTLVSTESGTMANDLNLVNGAIAEAHGKTLDLTGDLGDQNVISTLTFGAAGFDGVIVADFASTSLGPLPTIDVVAGTLRIGSAAAASMLSVAIATEVAAGASIDLDGKDVVITRLSGAGDIVDSGAGSLLILQGAALAGTISGAIALEIGDNATSLPIATVLSGTNTYTGGTAIEAGYQLTLGDGGTGGSIIGAVIDDGALVIDHSNAFTLANAISGGGGLIQRGAGVTTLTGANTFTGAVVVEAGAIAVGSAAEISGSGVVLDGGEIIATASLSLAGDLAVLSPSTIAAAHGATLTLAGDVTLGGAMTFGDAANDGTVVFAPTGGAATAACDVTVAAGTLRLGAPLATALTATGGVTTVEAAGTFDIDGVSVGVSHLAGDGRIIDSGAAASLGVQSGVFAGSISGAITLFALGDLSLTGAGDFTGGLIVGDGVTVTLGGAAAEAVSFASGDGELVLTASAELTGAVSGLAVGDRFDFEGVTFGAATKLAYKAGSHKLTITEGDHSVTIFVEGAYKTRDFQPSDDGHGGTLVTNIMPPAGHGPGAAHADALAHLMPDLMPDVLSAYHPADHGFAI